jgi:capsular polysaccharide transport system permease protein
METFRIAMTNAQLVARAPASPLQKRGADDHPDEQVIGERFEARRRKRALFIRYGFIFLVVAPTVLSTIYYGAWASKRYVSEAQFIVRGVSSNRATGLDSLFRSFGISRTVDDSYAVENYMLSRDAVRALETSLPLRDIFSRPEGDLFSRFPHFWLGSSFERLYSYYLERIKVTSDGEKGITTLKVQAYRAQDAQNIARNLLALAESFVNQMNARSRQDSVRSAETDVADATAKVLVAQTDLTTFRNHELLIDPSKNSLAQLETITQLTTELDHTQAQIAESKRTAANSPSIAVMQARADAMMAGIASERGKLAGTDRGLASRVSTFERLTLMRNLAEKSLSTALLSLESARIEARRQQIYIEEVVAPNLADESSEPQRIRAIATVLMVSTLLLAVGWLLTAGVKEQGN